MYLYKILMLNKIGKTKKIKKNGENVQLCNVINYCILNLINYKTLRRLKFCWFFFAAPYYYIKCRSFNALPQEFGDPSR